MPAYHSKIDGAGADEACGCALLPLKTKLRGPAPAAPAEGDEAAAGEEAAKETAYLK